MTFLLHAPEYGLPLIRRIVDHAIDFKSGGRDFGKNAMKVLFPDGSEKVFPWYQSYGWSRDLGAGPALVASALMALEAWSHGRIEKGEPVDKVVADVVGSHPPPPLTSSLPSICCCPIGRFAYGRDTVCRLSGTSLSRPPEGHRRQHEDA